MSTLVQKINGRLNYTRILEWGRLIAVTGAAQVFIQGISFVSGVLIIRLLPTQEYALYTLATAMLSNMAILADSGIKTSVMAHGGKVWQNRQKLGEVMATGIYLRKLFATVSVLVASPVILFLLRHHGASWFVAVGINISLLPVFYATLSGTLLEVVPKLQQRIVQLQQIQVVNSIGRAVLVGLTLLVLPYTAMAMVAFGLPQLWANIKLKKLAQPFIDTNQKPSIPIRAEMLKMVKRLLPDSIYLCVSGQITLWLISIFGTTAAVAQVGALGRLAMILTLVNMLFGVIVSPRFSRLGNSKTILIKRFAQIQIGLLCLLVCIVAGSWLLASEMLWVLGQEYANLEQEIVLLMIGSCLGLFAQSVFYLCTSRGWVINPLVSIPVSILAIICGAMFFNISTLQGIFIFNIFINSVVLVLHLAYGFYSIYKLEDEKL